MALATLADPAAGSSAPVLELGSEGVAFVTLADGSESFHPVTDAFLGALDAILDEMEEAGANGTARALILRTSAARATLGGADPEWLQGIADYQAGVAWSRAGQRVLRRLEQLPMPTIAASAGGWLGAGAEIALACGYRIVSDAPDVVLGFPQIRSAIIPAWGGTVRLPRLIGLRGAMQMILSGQRIRAHAAHALGLVDRVVPDERFDEHVRGFAADRVHRGRIRRAVRRGVARRLAEDTAPGRRLVTTRAARQVRRADAAAEVAARRALRTLVNGITLPLEQAFEAEAEAFGELIAAEEAHNLLHATALTRQETGPRALSGRRRAVTPPLAWQAGPEALSSTTAAWPLHSQAAVVGAGTTGTQLACLLAIRGIPVRLKDVRREALGPAIAQAHRMLDDHAKLSRLPDAATEQTRQRISATLRYGGFGAADVVIEATGGEAAARHRVLCEVEDHVQEHCALAPVVSSGSLAELQHGLRLPSRVTGLHFPGRIVQGSVVEVVRGPDTGDSAVATASALARHLGKIPIVVADAPGFLVHRLLIPYLNEALRLAEEGVPIDQVNGAMRQWGMPIGPIRLIDEIGTGEVSRLATRLHEAFGARLEFPSLAERLARAGRPGRAGGAGFYRYPSRGEPSLDPAAIELLGLTPPPDGTHPPVEFIQRRMVFAMLNEAAHALEAGIVSGPEVVDTALLAGAGFPDTRGGLLFYADRLGSPTVVRILEELRDRCGERFAPAPLVRQLAERNAAFYQVGRGWPATGSASGQGATGVVR